MSGTGGAVGASYVVKEGEDAGKANRGRFGSSGAFDCRTYPPHAQTVAAGGRVRVSVICQVR